MPLYIWQCKQCKEELEVLRKFDELEVPPTDEEAGTGKYTKSKNQCEHEFERKMTSAAFKIYGVPWL